MNNDTEHVPLQFAENIFGIKNDDKKFGAKIYI